MPLGLDSPRPRHAPVLGNSAITCSVTASAASNTTPGAEAPAAAMRANRLRETGGLVLIAGSEWHASPTAIHHVVDRASEGI